MTVLRAIPVSADKVVRLGQQPVSPALRWLASAPRVA